MHHVNGNAVFEYNMPKAAAQQTMNNITMFNELILFYRLFCRCAMFSGGFPRLGNVTNYELVGITLYFDAML
jgi:hypothetical protein